MRPDCICPAPRTIDGVFAFALAVGRATTGLCGDVWYQTPQVPGGRSDQGLLISKHRSKAPPLNVVSDFAADVLQRQMVQIRKKLLRPLHLIVRRYPAYHMTSRPQWHASSEKNRIPGLHRPPGHSKLRSSQHMESMCREESGRARSFDASAASSERPLCVPRAGHTQAI